MGSKAEGHERRVRHHIEKTLLQEHYKEISAQKFDSHYSVIRVTQVPIDKANRVLQRPQSRYIASGVGHVSAPMGST